MKSIYVVLLVLFFVQCTRKADEKQLEKVTELNEIILNIEDNLSIDEQEISGRLDSIKLMLDYLGKQPHDSGDVETRGALVRYFGIQKNYETYLALYPALIFDMEKYKAQVQNMEAKLNAGEISATDFEKQYNAAKRNLQQIDKQAADLSYNTFAVEGDYRRSHEKVKNLYNIVKRREDIGN